MAHTDEELANLETVQRYFSAINEGGMGAAMEAWMTPDIVQEEYPNLLLPTGARRDLAALREAAARGKALMAAQHFEIVATYARERTVIVESIWTGTVGVDAGPFKAGTELRARFAQFFELRAGRICAIRNYDCFDPW